MTEFVTAVALSVIAVGIFIFLICLGVSAILDSLKHDKEDYMDWR